jgi:hypothetical protein
MVLPDMTLLKGKAFEVICPKLIAARFDSGSLGLT